ncbi:hypothetical protein F4803DRAFT_525041 [Xylaria telfairii]|nr:hypothetical protein F4803DRAFT_525041 [Xylaria telfairii]
MIARINPWVSLDIMKIENSVRYEPGSKGGARTISAPSAARAIDGARLYHRAAVDKGDSQGSRLFKKRDDWATMLRPHNNMRRAFDNINRKEYEDKKFLPVWGVFGDATEKMKKTKGEKVLDDLDDLVIQLCSNLSAD